MHSLLSEYIRCYNGLSYTPLDLGTIESNPLRYIGSDSETIPCIVRLYAESLVYDRPFVFTHGAFTDPADGAKYKTVVFPDGSEWMADVYKQQPLPLSSMVGDIFYKGECVRDVIPEGWRLPMMDDLYRLNLLFDLNAMNFLISENSGGLGFGFNMDVRNGYLNSPSHRRFQCLEMPMWMDVATGLGVWIITGNELNRRYEISYNRKDYYAACAIKLVRA